MCACARASLQIWVFNSRYTQYIPLSVYELQAWLGAPCIYGAWRCVALLMPWAMLWDASWLRVGGGLCVTLGLACVSCWGMGHDCASGVSCVTLSSCCVAFVLGVGPDLVHCFRMYSALCYHVVLLSAACLRPCPTRNITSSALPAAWVLPF